MNTLFSIGTGGWQWLAPLVAAQSDSSSLLAVDIFDMVRKTDLVGWTCLTVIACFSIASWAVMLLKYVHITLASRQTRQFIAQCMAGSSSLDEAFKKAADFPDSPVSQLLREAYLELETEDWFNGYTKNPSGRQEIARAGIERVLERTIATEIDHLESYLTFLATTSNVSPFLGLFGTVWGIMAAFQALGTQSSAALASLAPGLATALITTVAGLFAAIPASVMYNYLTGKIRILTTRMDSFALELANIITKQIARDA